MFDAMAMARPVVSTSVGDIPEILSGCGWVVNPESPAALASALTEVFDDPSAARIRGRRAREKCVREYSWDAMESALASVFAPFEEA